MFSQAPRCSYLASGAKLSDMDLPQRHTSVLYGPTSNYYPLQASMNYREAYLK